MEKSVLYNLLEKDLLQKWIKEAEEDAGYFTQTETEAAEELLKELGEKNRKLLTAYSLAVKCRMDFVYYNLSVKILNFGVKIGMNLQNSFIESEE